MAGGNKSEGGRESRGGREDDRKEKKAAASQPAKSGHSELSEMIERRSQSTAVSRKKRSRSSSDSVLGSPGSKHLLRKENSRYLHPLLVHRRKGKRRARTILKLVEMKFTGSPKS